MIIVPLVHSLLMFTLVWGQSPSVCEDEWFKVYGDSRPAGDHVWVADGRSFRDGENLYAAVLVLSEDGSGQALVLLIEDAKTAVEVASLEFTHVLTPSELVRSHSRRATCEIVGLGPHAELAVTDLDADGRVEIVLESLPAGVCKDCPTWVRVVQLDGASSDLVVDEKCLQTEFGEGAGIVCRSVRNLRSTRPVFLEATYFLKSRWRR